MTVPPTPVDHAALADRLATARLAGTVVADMPRLDLATGWQVQAALACRLEAHLGRQCGWKLGATNAGAMAFLGVDRPIVGRLFANRVWHGLAGEAVRGAAGLEVEPEVILQLGPGLEVAAAFLGAEFNRPAIARPFMLGAGSIVADNAASFGLLCRHRLGLARLARPDRVEALIRIRNRDMCRGSAAAVLDGPLSAVAVLRCLLANDLRGLQPGDYIATGAMCRSVAVPAGAVPQVVRPRPVQP